MLCSIAQRRIAEQRDLYYVLVASHIQELANQPQAAAKIVVAQAAIKNRHRRLLLSACPFLRMCWVRSPEEDRHRRLRAGNNLVGEGLGAYIAQEFEEPDHEHVSFFNKNTLEQASIFEQLQSLANLGASESISRPFSDVAPCAPR